MDYNALVEKAMKAKQNSYSPYSNFKVGAALLSKNGEIFTGTNIENASYGLTVCAERSAIFKAVSDGKRKFKAIAIACDTDNFDYAFPCGACRQVMAEFFSGDFDVIVSINTGEYKVYKLSDLLPNAFRL